MIKAGGENTTVSVNTAQEYSHGKASRFFKSKRHEAKVVVYTCNHNTQEDDAE